ncbi:MAG: hypothetical protein Tsb0016_26450 [Sphingomonadales bacterium]
MAEQSPKLQLPFLIAAQAQKEITHNEALIALDALVQLTIEDRDLTAPPASPLAGQMWLVASPGSGDWSGQEGMLAQFIDGGWRFYAPFAGLGAWLRDERALLRHDGLHWLTGIAAITPPTADVPDPNGGATVDQEARGALAAVLQVLRDHRLIAP